MKTYGSTRSTAAVKKKTMKKKNREEPPPTLNLLRETSKPFLGAKPQAEAAELHPHSAQVHEPSLGFLEFIPNNELA